MTAIFYPDLSHYDLDRGITVEPGTVAVIAKATHGTLFLDRGYATIRQQAANVGAVFGAYHWLNHGNGAGQADYYYSQVGATPCMVDAEDMPVDSGFNGYLTVQDIVEFITALRAKGGICNLCYLPRWYWDQHMGGPSLQPLKDLGVGLVSSNYTTYSDTGPGWDVYVRDNGTVEPSGMTPVAWQYTDALPYGGGTCDFNAFRGSVDELRALITGGDDMSQQAENILWAAAIGMPTFVGSDGKTYPNVLWQWEVNRTKWQGTVDARIDALEAAAKAETAAVAVPTQDQVDAAVLKALSDPAVAKGIGDAIAAHLHVS